MAKNKQIDNYDFGLTKLFELPKCDYIYNANFKLEIKKSSIDCAGNGVFTLEPIKKNTVIGQYIGNIRDPEHACNHGKYSVETKSGKLIDAYFYPRTIMAMINDSYGSKFTNNCKLQVYELEAEIISTRDIQVNEELFLDYGNYYWI